jgi:hypothetical protein
MKFNKSEYFLFLSVNESFIEEINLLNSSTKFSDWIFSFDCNIKLFFFKIEQIYVNLSPSNFSFRDKISYILINSSNKSTSIEKIINSSFNPFIILIAFIIVKI